MKIEGKIEENEENRGLNDKKAFDDQFTNFFSTVSSVIQKGQKWILNALKVCKHA